MVGNLAEAPAPVGAALDVLDVGHRFDLRGTFLPVLSRISLRIEPGELVSLLGPSGCGKSTLLRMVAGLEAPTGGRTPVWGGGGGGGTPRRWARCWPMESRSAARIRRGW